MTYKELLEKAEQNGMNLAAVTLVRMMDIVEKKTGVWPNWTDEAPEWVCKKLRALNRKVRR